MPFDAKLSKFLNLHRRNCLGAVGNTQLSLTREATKDLTIEESLALKGILESGTEIQDALKVHATLIENFYLSYGSELTKRSILTRKAIKDKMNKGDEITEEEVSILAGKRVYAMTRGPYKKKPKRPLKTDQNLLSALFIPI